MVNPVRYRMKQDYHQFTTRDFVLDDAFRRWVFEPNEQNMTFWHTFLLRHPHQQATVDEAASLLLHLRTHHDDLTHASQQRIWQVLEQAERPAERPVETPVQALPNLTGLPVRRFGPVERGRWWGLSGWRAAASLTGTLLLAGSAAWYAFQSRPQRVHTAFGETRSLTLPDGSTVLLNGNSTLTFTDDWTADAPREVWLDGEGFFTVTKRQHRGSRVKFVTHTSELDITVLGTQFNVNTRRGSTDVTLVEGRVQLTKVGAVRPQTVELKPGQVASAQPGIERVDVRAEKPQLHTSWTQHQFVFDDTSLSAIAEQLRDTYGLELVFEDRELANRRFTGNLTNESIETLLTTLSLTFDLTVRRDGNRIVLQRNS